MNALVLLLAASLSADPSEPVRPAQTAYSLPDSKLGQPMNDKKTVFINTKEKSLWLKTVVARDTGVLEMFLCRTGTKEHESVVAIDSPAFTIHAGLLALGLEPGATARWEEEFVAPTGPELEITVHWTDKDGKQQSKPASEWIRRVTARWYTTKCDPDLARTVSFPKDLDFRYFPDDEELLWFGSMTDEDATKLKALSSSREWATKIDELKVQTVARGFEDRWVFAGSGFWTDEETGERSYLAESGNLICVANFGDAMIDVASASSAENSSLLYEPWTERVPAPGTPVLVRIRKASAN